MQKLTLKRRVSGIHAVESPDGETLGVIDPSDLDLDNDELEALLKKHAEKAAGKGAVREFMRRIDRHMARTGSNYHEAFCEVARADSVLASEYRAEVLRTDLL